MPPDQSIHFKKQLWGKTSLTSSSTSCVWGEWRCSRGPPRAGTSWQVSGEHLLSLSAAFVELLVRKNPQPQPSPKPPSNQTKRCTTAHKQNRRTLAFFFLLFFFNRFKGKVDGSVRSPQDSGPRWRAEWARKSMKIQQGSSSLPGEGGGGKLLKWSCSRPQQEIICLIKDLPPSCFLNQSQPCAPKERLRLSGYPRGSGGGSLPPIPLLHRNIV